MRIGVTGASGFIGGHLLPALLAAGHTPVALVRNPAGMPEDPPLEIIEIPEIGAESDLSRLQTAMRGLDGVVHLAASVHDMTGALDESAYRNTNVAGSGRVFEAAKAAGVKRFVYLSSVKAAGEHSADTPLRAETPPAPEDAYGRSKLDAENLLRELAADGTCSLVILRPTFVYGWPAVGNFKTLLSAVIKGIPLPLAAIRNRRDLTYVGNLADAVCTACLAPGLGTAPYFICDGAAVSTPELIRSVAQAFSRPARLVYMPLWLLRLAGKVTGRAAMIARLSGNLEVDGGPFRRDAGWLPPYNMAAGLRICAAAWHEDHLGGV